MISINIDRGDELVEAEHILIGSGIRDAHGRTLKCLKVPRIAGSAIVAQVQVLNVSVTRIS